MTIERKRLIIEMGMGVDQHGQEPTVAAARAVRNAIAHNALPGGKGSGWFNWSLD